MRYSRRSGKRRSRRYNLFCFLNHFGVVAAVEVHAGFECNGRVAVRAGGVQQGRSGRSTSASARSLMICAYTSATVLRLRSLLISACNRSGKPGEVPLFSL
jgi:hypothetical protein